MRFIDRLISQSIYTRAHFQLVLDGVPVGLIKSIEGGALKAEAIAYQDGTDQVPRRLRGRTKFEDLRLNGGIAMGVPFLDWMADFMAGKVTRRNGAIEIADFDGYVRARREFYGAMITEVGFPKFDADDKNNVYLSVALAPEAVTFQNALEGKPRRIRGHDDTVGHRATKANSFRFSFDGNEDWCRRVTKVDGFSIKQKPVEYADNNPNGMHQLGNGATSMGAPAVARKLPGKIEMPSAISVYMPEVDSFGLAQRVQAGLARRDGSDVLAGARLVAIDPEKNELFEIEFVRLHILSIAVDGSSADADAVKQVKIEFVPEQIKFTPNQTAFKQGARLSEKGQKMLSDAMKNAVRDASKVIQKDLRSQGKVGGVAADAMSAVVDKALGKK